MTRYICDKCGEQAATRREGCDRCYWRWRAQQFPVREVGEIEAQAKHIARTIATAAAHGAQRGADPTPQPRDERAAIVAWLRRVPAQELRTCVHGFNARQLDVCALLADEIERGEHLPDHGPPRNEEGER